MGTIQLRGGPWTRWTCLLLIGAGTRVLDAGWCEPEMRDAARRLLPEITAERPVGEVLFREDFRAGLRRWRADNGWRVIAVPGAGRIAEVRAGEDFEDLILNHGIPVTPGHPIAVYYETRLVSGGTPLYMRIDFLDATGKAGKPYARQAASRTGREWTRNVVLISDWFPDYTRRIILRFHQNPKSGTTSQLRRVRVIDLAPAVWRRLEADVTRWHDALLRLRSGIRSLPEQGQAFEAWWRGKLTAAARDLMRQWKAADTGESPVTFARWRTLRPLGATALRLEAIARGVRNGAVTTRRFAVFQVRAITSVLILPDTPDLPDARPGAVAVRACPGEYEPVRLVLWALRDVPGVLPTIDAPESADGVRIPAEAFDMFWVKCWYQAGGAPYSIRLDRTRKVLVPELLLRDDTLVRVDERNRHNFLKLSFPEGSRYVPIDDPTPPEPAWGFKYSIEEFPVRDAPRLLPADVPARRNKQLWILVHIPPDTPAGSYAGGIRWRVADGTVVGRTPLIVEVLPFRLPLPATHYDLHRPYTCSLYYWGTLDPAGRGCIGYRDKSEKQFRAELRAMYRHNITAPAMILPPSIVYGNEKAFRRHLQIMREAGMSGRPLYTADSGMIGVPTDRAGFDRLRRRVEQTIRIAREYGFTGVYFYGLDEARGERLLAERPAWRTVHEAGGKVFVSGYAGHLQAVGDLLDLLNRAGDPAGEDVAGWHRYGHRVWNYAFPQTPVEDPEVYRRHYGLYDWLHDLDGVCTYCFMDSSGTQWNDFDGTNYRDHCLAYPTADGVVGTLAFEGLREALDDVRYATLLMQRIAAAETGSDARRKRAAAQARRWIEGLDPRSADLDAVRARMIDEIVNLSGADGK